MFRFHKLGWRLRRPFLTLRWRLRRYRNRAVDAFYVGLSVLLTLQHQAKPVHARVREVQYRKERTMQKPTTNHVFDATSVWGIEVMDPLEQWTWAQKLWQRLSRPGLPLRPLLLLYSPPTERTALRGLTALARISRETGFVVRSFAPEPLSVLPKMASTTASTLLVHRAPRFVNLGNGLAALLPCLLAGLCSPRQPQNMNRFPAQKNS
jgi:hypothetical protein